ncbi:3'-5' ssDNA/RNA exonuclease TatD-like [Ruditapes philippinarum]|uniref:3'-5' ssDNA/RNA exonuclease TatD-like n=1 Tax=Ruditapes philippinarum TaxID=129788 RepID=UPI00295B2898|nr:3'-5' ssDNA/RNA exonuclease TatD-like [Ruditapes philippinarum]
MKKHLEMDSRVSVTVGVHPHMLFIGTYNGSFRKLEALVNDTPRVVGIGEVGLDFTTACRCRQSHDRTVCKRDKLEAQRQFLRMCLPMADRMRKPIVIHCRDSGNGLAAKQTLLLFRELNLTHMPVQRYCFIGSSEELVQWSTVLPNCMFSLSMRSLQDRNTREALVQHADAKRLLLETDADRCSLFG